MRRPLPRLAHAAAAAAAGPDDHRLDLVLDLDGSAHLLVLPPNTATRTSRILFALPGRFALGSWLANPTPPAAPDALLTHRWPLTILVAA